MNSEVIVKNICKTYNRIKVIDRLSFKAEAGKPLVIFGPSGCGKSTLLRLIAGLETPDEGEILLHGRPASTPGWILEPYKRNIGFVFQNSALWPHMTIRKNIQFGMKGFSKKESRSYATELMERFGIGGIAGNYPGQVSGGQARRAAIARALAVRPELLLMDEPLTNLEKELKDKILDYILGFAGKTGVCLLYVTHDPDEAGRTGGVIYRMKDGCFEKDSA